MSRVVLGLTLFLAASGGAALGLIAGGGGVVPVPRSSPGSVAGGPSFADVVARVNPGVVHITVREGSARPPLPGGGLHPPVPRRGEGSGFIVDRAGYILTNQHLVSGPSRIRVRLADKREMLATFVGADPNTDLALLKVDAPDLEAVPFGDSDRLRVGEWVCAIGNPYVFEHSVTVGVVSAKRRKLFNASFDAYIQTDAAINPGNSGGPLINAAGEAIGINAAVSLEAQGIGFAVPINTAREVLGQLRSRGRVSRGYLGVQLHELDPDLGRLVGMKDAKGAVVLDLVKGEAGESAGLKRYDVISAVSGQPVEDGDQLVRTIAARAPGSPVTLTVYRDGRPLSLEARLSARGANERVSPAPSDEATSPAEGDALGLVVVGLGEAMRADLGVPLERVGVVVQDVVGLSAAADALTHGDIIVEVNRQPTPTVEAYRKAVAAVPADGVAWVFVYRPRPGGSFLAKLEVDR